MANDEILRVMGITVSRLNIMRINMYKYVVRQILSVLSGERRIRLSVH